MNRYVRKGEHGIAILAPLFGNRDEQKSETEKMVIVVGYRVVYVFDISQTDGESIPEPPEWKSPEKNAALAQRLIVFANSREIKVSEKLLAGDVQGVSKGGAIELSPTAGTSTLIHEIAHELLHHNNDRPIDFRVRELEAEAVAYVVAKHFGLGVATSPNYIVLNGVGAESIMEHQERIRKIADEIITAVEY
jgi:hypothetical protein